MKSFARTLKSIDKCRETAYNAKSEWAKEYWHRVADVLETKLIFDRKYN